MDMQGIELQLLCRRIRTEGREAKGGRRAGLVAVCLPDDAQLYQAFRPPVASGKVRMYNILSGKLLQDSRDY